ncbi:MAG TPA: helix-hairpin-helix domain-containing protein [Bacteroidota bacterium]|jgi:competence protein ComEA
MRLLNELNRNLGFTPQEGRVVLFLVAAFLLGIGLKVVKSSRTERPAFDYAASDSEFEARSRLLDRIDSSGADESAGSGSGPQSRAKNEYASQLLPRSININTASKDELTRLPGIGEAMAERILDYREENGSFSTVGELMNIRGIGRKKLDRISPYCTVGP